MLRIHRSSNTRKLTCLIGCRRRNSFLFLMDFLADDFLADLVAKHEFHALGVSLGATLGRVRLVTVLATTGLDLATFFLQICKNGDNIISFITV